MNFAPTDLVSAHRWECVTFTTYALSLSFFEAVVLDAPIRGGASQALILADVQGVRASLSEQARSAWARITTWSPSPSLLAALFIRRFQSFRIRTKAMCW